MTILAFGAPGMQEMMIIFLIVLLLFGAKKIPELARGVGKGMGEFKKAKKEFEDEIKAGEVEGEKQWDEDVKRTSAKPTPAADTADAHPAAAEDDEHDPAHQATQKSES